MWSEDDLKWLAANYPAVKVRSSTILEGSLVFRMLFRDGSRYINPSPELLVSGGGAFISGIYGVKIEHEGKGYFPKAFETGGKIKATATSKGLRLIDLHIFPGDDSLCLASPMVTHSTVAAGLSLQQYMEDFLIPYFFAQEYFAKNNTWPWGDLSHGIFGHLEWLGRIAHPTTDDVNSTLINIKSQLKEEHFKAPFAVRPRMHHQCLCGSRKRFRDCHPDAKKGITEVRKLVYSRKVSLDDYS